VADPGIGAPTFCMAAAQATGEENPALTVERIQAKVGGDAPGCWAWYLSLSLW